MDIKFTIFISCVICQSGLINAQFEDLAECLGSEEFGASFVSCLGPGVLSALDTSDLPALDDVLGASHYDNAEGGTRKLQSVHGNLDLAPQKYILGLKMKEYGINENHVYNELVSYANAWATGGRDASLFERLRHINVRKFVSEAYMTRFTEHYAELVTEALYLRGYAQTMRSRLAERGWSTPDIQDKLAEILQEDLAQKVQCLERYTPAEFEESLEWIQCLVECDSLAGIAECSAEVFATSVDACGRVQWFSDVLVGIVIALVNKTSCDYTVVNKTSCDYTVLSSANLTTPIQLTEGGVEGYMEFKAYVPPGVLCLGPDPLTDPIALGLVVAGNVFGFDVQCNVEMQLTTASWLDNIVGNTPIPGTRSKCRVPRRASRQVAVGYHSATTNNSAVFQITAANWNETFLIPLLPVVDHRVDGDTTVDFTMRLYVQGESRGETTKLPIAVTDTDPPADPRSYKPVECYSLNDPHIMTFDGHYYNNFHHGAFYLYKHQNLPYEVQTIYQPCEVGSRNGSCNCAVAVRSGDDVFVMDRCRRKSQECPQGVCAPVQTVVMYTNGELTPGTRVFKMNGGLRSDVVLPHGTIVKIVTSNDLLNVWITPGSYDRDYTRGLCGTFNVDSADDLMMPNGTLYSGPGNGTGEQPKDFSKAWRVPNDQLLFEGAPVDGALFEPLKACQCTHMLFGPPSCECGRGVITELCDLFMDGEYEENITSIEIPSLHSSQSSNYLDDIDLDVSYDPPLLANEGWQGIWNETDAWQFCGELITNTDNPIIQECNTRGITFEDAERFCVQDIQLLDNTNWQYSALDNAKFRCYNQLVRNVSVRTSVLSVFPNSSCINECLDRGQCVQAMCACQTGYWGPDCRLTDTSLPALTPRDTQICDNRNQLCNFATIMGVNITDAVDLRCQVKNIEVTSNGVDYLPKRKTTIWEHNMTVISMNQAACPLPMNGSYEISVAWRSSAQTPPATETQSLSIAGRLMRYKRDLEIMATESGSVETFIYITHDSRCYECDVTGKSCTRKSTNDYCWISNECWAPDQTKPNDTCRYCHPATSASSWTMYDVEACNTQKAEEDALDEEERKDLILRASLGGCICAIVVIVVIIIFCVTRNKDKKTRMTESEVIGNDDILPRPGTVTYHDGMYGKSAEGFDNLGMRADGELDKLRYDVLRHNSFGNGSQRQTRVDVLRGEDLGRNNSLSNASVKSRELETQESFKTAL